MLSFLYHMGHRGYHRKKFCVAGGVPIVRPCYGFKNYYFALSYDVAVFQWITSCHKNRMSTRVLTLLREYVRSLTTSVTTM